MDAQDYIDELRAKKRRNLIIGIAVAAVCLLMFLMTFAGGKDRELSETDAQVTQVCVSGAVVIISYAQLQHQIILEYVDADRSGTVDQVCKTLTPLIDGVSTGRYRVSNNLTTGKIVYTYTSN